MDYGVYSIKSVSDEKIISLIDAKQSFVLEGINRLNMGDAIKTVEKVLNAKGLKYRTYTKGRAAIMSAAAIPASEGVAGAVSLIGWVAAAGIGVHRLVTWNADYEIAKNL